MKRLSFLAALSLSLAACGGTDAEAAIVKVHVLDVDGTTLGAVPVTAELRSTPQAGVKSEVLDFTEASTDGSGVAYLQLREAKEYRVNARLDLPNEAGCAWVASGWVNSGRIETTLKLDKKICS